MGLFPAVGKYAKYLTDSDIRDLKPGEKKYRKSVFRNLRIEVESQQRSGTKSFKVEYYFPPKAYTQFYTIGVYGKGQGQFTLKQAKEEQIKLYAWMEENPLKNPKERKKELKIEKLTSDDGHTFGELIENYLSNSGNKESTIKDKRNKFIQIYEFIPKKTKIRLLQYNSKFEGRNGRERIMEIITSTEKRGKKSHAKKLMGVMRDAFNYAIHRGWMDKGQNPAENIGRSFIAIGHKEKHHPAITDWKELPELFDCFENNPGNADAVVISALKCCFLTGLRVGSLVAMRWDYVNREDGWIDMPAEVMKGGIDFEVPLTQPLLDVIEKLKDYPSEYVFWSFRGRKTPYLNPSALNNALKNMGYGGKHTAHGTRTTIQTCGQEVLGCEGELIERCLAHKIGDKVRQAYDRAKFLDERKKFLTTWGDALLAHGLKV